jgi:hypothetical protein
MPGFLLVGLRSKTSLVTKDGDNVSSLADNFQMGLPIAITVNGPGRMYFDLELVPVVVDKPREIQLVVNPGFLWRLGHSFAAGSRVGFLGEFGPDEDGAIRNHAVDRQKLADRAQLFQGLLCGRRLHLSLQQAG